MVYLSMEFHCLVQPLPSSLDAILLGLNLGVEPGCSSFQGGHQLPQGLHLCLPQALNFSAKSSKCGFHHLEECKPRDCRVSTSSLGSSLRGLAAPAAPTSLSSRVLELQILPASPLFTPQNPAIFKCMPSSPKASSPSAPLGLRTNPP